MSNKRISAEIVALTPNIPGQAVIQISNWDAVDGLKFKIEANGGRGYLNKTTGRSEWGSSEYWFEPESIEQDGQWLRVHIGQTTLDPLLEAGARYKITLCADATSHQQSCTLNIADDVYPSTAAGSASTAVSGGALATPEPVTLATPAPVIEPAVPTAPAEAEPELDFELPAPESGSERVAPPAPELESVAAAEPAPATPVEPKKGKSKVIVLALLGVLIIALLAALGWWLSQQKLPSLAGGGATTANVAGAADADGLSASGGCALASMGTVDELQFVQSCLQETQDSDTLLAVIQHAKANNHCGVAQRLYANRAQSGDSVIALAYAKEYDPQFYADNTCFKAADTETALYWYETVLLNEPNNAEAAQRVEELNQ